jgi:hypothetical protein
VRLHGVTPLELRAGGFADSDLAGGPATGALLSLFIAREGKRSASCSSVSYRSVILYRRQSDKGVHVLHCYCVTPESAQPYETAYLAASGKMMPAATASLAELRYALLTSLSVLGAAEAVTSGCSVRAQLIALVGMTLAASAGLAELRYALLRYALLPSLSVLGAAEAATVCSVRAQLIALVGMTLTASAGLAELRYALLTSLSVLGAAEAATGCSVRAQLIALV